MTDENTNPDALLHIRGLNHLTMPVKDRYRAARFFLLAWIGFTVSRLIVQARFNKINYALFIICEFVVLNFSTTMWVLSA